MARPGTSPTIRTTTAPRPLMTMQTSARHRPRQLRPALRNERQRGLRIPRKPRAAMTASSNRALLERFYAAFSARDGSGMGACYGAAAHFRDPVFELEGARIGAMWRMLCSRGADLRIEATDLSANTDSGSATW